MGVLSRAYEAASAGQSWEPTGLSRRSKVGQEAKEAIVLSEHGLGTFISTAVDLTLLSLAPGS